MVACTTLIGRTHRNAYVDRPPSGAYTYRIALGANWLDDPNAGDEYLISPSIYIKVR
jgi:hypothetical protein